MSRPITVLKTLLLAVAGLMPLNAAMVVRGPYLQSAGHDRITVCWRTDVPTSGQLVHGLSDDAMLPPVSDIGTDTEHAITLTGLQPSTRYFYRIQGTPESGDVIDVGGSNFWFKTAPSPGTRAPVRIWALGDSGYNNADSINLFNSYQAVTAQQGKTTDVFLMLGDNAYTGGSDTEYQYAVFNRYASLLRNSPLWAAFGNHDSYTSEPPYYTGPVPYDSIFHHPTAGECGGAPSGAERYFSFDHGNVHFICLDTNTPGNYDDVPGGTPGMVDWLKTDLENCSADWIIAYMHQGPYTKGQSHDSDIEWQMRFTRNYIVPLLETYGADLVLCGHSHVYERSGLIDGHYGMSTTWDESTMRKWPGNGSDDGAVDSTGAFIFGSPAAGGAYQKPAATARSGTVYSVVGASSLAHLWVNGSSATVNPTPHPAHQVSLLVVGGMVIDIEGNRMQVQYLDTTGAVRDDFTLLKGAEYRLGKAEPAFTEPSAPGVAFGVARSGATAFAEDLPFQVTPISGGAVTPAAGSVAFSGGMSEAILPFSPVNGQPGSLFNVTLQPSTRPVQPGAVLRAAYHLIGPTTGQGAIEATPANTWHASRLGIPPASPASWSTDPDGDGIPLSLEYAAGGDPTVADSLLRGEFEGNSWIWRYTRFPGRTDVSLEAMLSEDLVDWQPSGAADTSDGPATSIEEPRKVTVQTTSPAHFIRLKAVMQP